MPAINIWRTCSNTSADYGHRVAPVPADLSGREPVLPPVHDRRGWPVLHRMQVLQAPEGCDYDFLVARTPDQLTFREPVTGRS